MRTICWSAMMSPTARCLNRTGVLCAHFCRSFDGKSTFVRHHNVSYDGMPFHYMFFSYASSLVIVMLKTCVLMVDYITPSTREPGIVGIVTFKVSKTVQITP